MRDGHLSTAAVHDHAEGLLGGDEAVAAARHVERCPECAAEVEAVRRLRSAASALPAGIDPGVDLRAGIRSGMRGRAPGVGGGRPRRVAWRAAAALALAAIPTALAVDWLVRGEGGEGEATTAETVLGLDREYARAARDLTATLAADGGRLPPEAARLLESSLDTVEKALAESRAALRADPESPVLRELVLAMHRQRLDVLRQAAVLAAESEGRS